MRQKAVQQGRSEVRDAKNNERHVRGRREVHGALNKARHVCERRRDVRRPCPSERPVARVESYSCSERPSDARTPLADFFRVLQERNGRLVRQSSRARRFQVRNSDERE
jgi:hypothetical protein